MYVSVVGVYVRAREFVWFIKFVFRDSWSVSV